MWYKQTIAHIRGEYWLNENGPEYAQGEIADVNHKMIAESHLLNELGNDIADESWGTQTYSNARNMFLDALQSPYSYLGEMPEYIEELQAQHGEDWRDYADFDNYLIWLNTRHHQEEYMRKVQEEFVRREIGGMKDPRKHVAQHYDWVAVRGPNIEVWEMNNLARIRIKNQIEQIYDDESEEFGNYGYDEDESWKESPKFNLSILSTGKYIEGVSYNDLVSGEWQKRLREPEVMEVGRRKPITNVPGYQYEGG